jgi:L-ascorbate metabolism protein UlaG (beta-lactamase superfamily)
MDIKYLGHSSFFIKGKQAKLVTDPYDPRILEMKFPKVEADIITVSHQHDDHNQTKLVDGSPLIIDWPGQYERKGMRVYGFQSYHDNKQGSERGENIIFKIEDDLTVLHCGDLGYMPDGKLLDEIGDVDILMIPVGGYYTIDAAQAAEIIKKIEPAIVIPMHYRTSKTIEGPVSKLATIDEFLHKMGVEKIEPVNKLTVKKEDLEEEMKVIVMTV